ncbi:MAG TPA: SpoIIE family protein phosphatase [Azonexus sp.]|nr:SpoIIE family protein phosphatase [Azonexus sp.]
MENLALDNGAVVAYDYAVAGRPLPGESQSGDAALVRADQHGILVAVVDGLGHGDEAAHAAQVAIATLGAHIGQPVVSLLQQCHEALRPTRGAAVALVTIDPASATVSWSGVGNVEGVLIPANYGTPRHKSYLISQGGVVGYCIPAVHARGVQMHPGDRLILATDGIDERFSGSEIPAGTPQQVAKSILERHGKASDDALVLVLCWLGTARGQPCGGVP